MAKFQDVSVVTLALNARATIEEALFSVLSQSGVAEIIVIDDGSTDGTADVVRALGDPRIRILPGPRSGFTAALNVGLQATTQDLVALCDSDDWWAPDRLSWQRRMMSERPELIAVSGGYASATPKGRHVSDLATDIPPQDVTANLREGRTVTSFCTWLTRRDALEAVGFARTWFETGSDIDLQCRLGSVGPVWHHPVVCYHYRLHEASVTHQQPSVRRVFFEETARLFARQRQDTGADDLMRGTPPAIPDATGDGAAPSSARQQIAGQLTGTAWRAFQAGNRRRALTLITRAALADPGRIAGWRGLGVMIAKTVLKRL